ncbi:MAG: NAD-dependent epimerase/dehydratase family protein [Pseudonocardiaceae bacterium]
MRVLVPGGTWFLGRRVVERLHERGDSVLVVHRGRSEPEEWIPARHLHTDRRRLADHAAAVAEFAPDAVVDSCPLTGADVDAVLPVLPEVPTVVLSSQDVYAAFTGLRDGREVAAVPITEDSELWSERYPYRGSGIDIVPDDYDKLDVEDRWLRRGAVVLRLPLIYGPHDRQRREEAVLRRLRAHRSHIPIGVGNLLWTRGHVDDLATGILAAIDNRAADGLAVNLGETHTVTVRSWLTQILDAAGGNAELVTVADTMLPPDLAITAAPAQHMLISVARAQHLLDWLPGDPVVRIKESVRWHLDHPPTGITWTDADSARDDSALAVARH